MGSITKHDIAGYIEKYDLSAFVETGLYKGNGLTHAATFPQFQKLVSIDILPQWIKRGLKLFAADKRITLLLGNSFEVLPEALAVVEGHSTFWWLDAHLPESCMDKQGKMEFEGTELYDDSTTFPLAKELEVILTRDISHDVFLIDDLRIYENGNYYFGNWKTRDKYNAPDGADFVEELLGDTHTIARGNAEHGFIIAEPRI
jgi:hypothetical protein